MLLRQGLKNAGAALILRHPLRRLKHFIVPADYAAELDDEEREWRTIRYTSVPVDTEVGTRAGLLGTAQAGTDRAWLLISLAPLEYNGTVDQAG